MTVFRYMKFSVKNSRANFAGKYQGDVSADYLGTGSGVGLTRMVKSC
jgi:hypothetical protein